jgi:hypothetical protein
LGRIEYNRDGRGRISDCLGAAELEVGPLAVVCRGRGVPPVDPAPSGLSRVHAITERERPVQALRSLALQALERPGLTAESVFELRTRTSRRSRSTPVTVSAPRLADAHSSSAQERDEVALLKGHVPGSEREVLLGREEVDRLSSTPGHRQALGRVQVLPAVGRRERATAPRGSGRTSAPRPEPERAWPRLRLLVPGVEIVLVVRLRRVCRILVAQPIDEVRDRPGRAGRGTA